MWSPDQTAKTVTKFLYQGYILIFRAPARLLSNQGANFMSSIIDELCTLLQHEEIAGHTIPPTNKLVGGEITSKNYANDWEAGRGQKGQLAMTPGWDSAQPTMPPDLPWLGYSPHYFMFGCRPMAPSWLLASPPLGVQRHPWEVPLPRMCGQICGYCSWLTEGCPPGSSGPVNARSPTTEMVLQLKDRHSWSWSLVIWS